MKTGNVGSDGGRSYSFYYLQLFMVQLNLNAFVRW